MEKEGNGSTTNGSESKKCKLSVRTIKRSRYSPRKETFRKNKKQKKVMQLIAEATNDENTTTSENSEGTGIFEEVDWEANLESDAKLVDEFAPRLPKNTEKGLSRNRLPEDTDPVCSPPPPQLPRIEKPPDQESQICFAADDKIFVRVKETSDRPNEWYSAVVVEVDLDEEEVLIKYTEGKCVPPMEWISLSSNRITSVKHPPLPQSRCEKLDVNSVKDISVGVHNTKGVKETNTKGTEEKDVRRAEEAIVRCTNDTNLRRVEDIRASPAKEVPVSADDGTAGDESVAALVRQHAVRRSGPRVRGGSFRRTRGSAYSTRQALPVPTSKFVEGEVVLAKWSEHRMHKFPAVIKTILPAGKYDVLFYDGFEKTIIEEHLYKTTDEEVAKYQKATPSEADTFVDIDANSKEARRQRKKKTFDDYVFAREIKMTKKKTLPSVDRLNVPRRSYPKTVAGGVETEEVTDAGSGAVPGKRIKRRRRLHDFDDSNLTPSPTTNKPLSASPNSSATAVTPPTTIDGGEPSKGTTVLMEKVEETDEINVTEAPPDQTDESESNITTGTGVQKTVAVPDSTLPVGWSKEAVLSNSNSWETILVSPEGKRLTNIEELKLHFESMSTGSEPPPSLNFESTLGDSDVKLEPAPVVSKEQTLPISSTPKIWWRRRGGRRGGRGARRGQGGTQGARGGARGIRGHISRQGGIVKRGGPRTLLPFQKGSSASYLPASESELEWRCPKDECDKKFRKESLLQMHIKHYHSDLQSLVQNVPKMVDLACARSESANSDWKASADLPKPVSVAKKISPRQFSSPDHFEEPPINTDQFLETAHSSTQNTVSGRTRKDSGDKRSLETVHSQPVVGTLPRPSEPPMKSQTIKTMLPARPSPAPQQPLHRSKGTSELHDEESDDEYIERKKNGSRIFKVGKLRRGGRFNPSGELHYLEEDGRRGSVDSAEDGVILERLKSEEFINCICGFREEDGLMIQCEICMCWQHGLCSGIETETDVPDRYVCAICRDPFRVRSSKKYLYAQHYLTQGKLPRLACRSRNDGVATKEMILKRSFDLTASLIDVQKAHRSLAAKLNIAQKADHPKLYMWAKNWEEESKQNRRSPKEIGEDGSRGDIAAERGSGPQPEAPIDFQECRIRLLDHVEQYYSLVEDRLTSLQTQIAALESLDQDLSGSSSSDKVTKQTIHWVLRDLESVNRLASITNC